jgi:chorismate mutase/prephenate dehydratase
MTRIESRPLKNKKWEYLFFVDIEGYSNDTRVKKAIKEIEKSCLFLKTLGSYPKGREA